MTNMWVGVKVTYKAHNLKLIVRFYDPLLINKEEKMAKTEELKWQAESDASTMARYQEIMQDKARMNRAIKEAKRQASDLSKRASAMNNVARTRKR